MSRVFSTSQRVALYLAAGGKCEACGVDLEPGWHADHKIPWSKGGQTDVTNGQALCPTCNLRKGDMMPRHLRAWQKAALDKLYANPTDFLVVATPGAGKTTFALTAARQMLDDGTVTKVIVVVPTAHLRSQWAVAAESFDIHLDHRFENANEKIAGDYTGTVITYQSVASNTGLWRKLATPRTLVILDEVHHAGDRDHLTWGPALQHAFEMAGRRVLLSGTPFRTDGARIPFVNYDMNGRCIPGHDYSYGMALRDANVVRPVEFLALNSEVQWQNSGSVETTTLDQATDETMANALRSALSPTGNWIPSVLEQADAELSRQREVTPDAGGLVIASYHEDAKAYAQHLKVITGQMPTIALADDPGASDAIARFSRGTSRWLVAVRMVSEGVDIPRLSVGVYATNIRSEMFVRQVVGRFVRLRGPEDETVATIFMPSIQPLLDYASEIESTVDAVLSEQAEQEARDAKESSAPLVLDLVEPLSSSEAEMHSVTARGEVYAEAELKRAMELSAGVLPSNTTPAQAAAFLRKAGMGRVVGQQVVDRKEPVAPLADRKKASRTVYNRAVNKYARMIGAGSNEPFGKTVARVHNALRGNGPVVDQAELTDIQRRTETVQQWIENAR